MDKKPESQPTQTNDSVDINVPIIKAPQSVVKPQDTDTEITETLTFQPVQDKKKFAKLQKKKVVVGMAVGFVLLAFGAVGYIVTGRNDETQQTTVNTSTQPTKTLLGAAVSLVDGRAQKSTDGQVWTDLAAQAELFEGDIVRTEPSSRLILTLDDGSVVRLNDSTTVKLTSLAADDVKIENTVGEVYSRVVASERTFQVEIEGTSYTALGTAFKTINKAEDKGVQVYHSAVAVEGVETKVSEGKQFYKKHSNQSLANTLSDVSVDEMKSNAFVLWNYEQDSQTSEFKDKLGHLTKITEQKPVTEPAPAGNGVGIKLTASKTEKGVVLKWTLSGVSAPDGFKIVRSSKSATPTYGKDEANFIGADARSFTWTKGDGGLYTYRVCAFRPNESTCNNYSNAVKIESPEIMPEKPVSGAVTLTNSGLVFSWTAAGSAPHGFKFLVAQSPNPVYGGSNVLQKYTGDLSIDITDKNLTAGTYHARVCKYTNSSFENGCMDYSNNVTFTIP
jgi:hypothetical protein